MSTSLVSNGDKGVWIDHGVGEVWLAALSTRIRERPGSHPELLALSEEFEEALAMDWIVGALQYDFGSLLKIPSCRQCCDPSVPTPPHVYVPSKGWIIA